MLRTTDFDIGETFASAVKDENERWLYREMIRYIRFLSGVYGVQGHWSLNPDDLQSECYLALARCWRAYGCRLGISLTQGQFLAVAKTSVKHAIGTMKYKAFLVAGRRGEFEGVSLNDEELNLEIDGGGDPSDVFDSAERMSELVGRLSAFELLVVNALLGGDDRVAMYIKATAARRTWVFKSPLITITPLIVARALCVPVVQVEQAYSYIAQALEQVSQEPV